jgi:manganese/iron transport system ATP-binding protein
VFTQNNLQKAFGGVLRHFVLGGEDLHDDDDSRQVTVLTDDERPFVIYGEAEARGPQDQGRSKRRQAKTGW